MKLSIEDARGLAAQAMFALDEAKNALNRAETAQTWPEAREQIAVAREEVKRASNFANEIISKSNEDGMMNDDDDHHHLHHDHPSRPLGLGKYKHETHLLYISAHRRIEHSQRRGRQAWLGSSCARVATGDEQSPRARARVLSRQLDSDKAELRKLQRWLMPLSPFAKWLCHVIDGRRRKGRRPGLMLPRRRPRAMWRRPQPGVRDSSWRK